MIKSKMLVEYEVKGYQVFYEYKGYDMKIGICGIFDSVAVHWDYYAVSFSTIGGVLKLTADIAKNNSSISIMSNDIANVKTHFRKYETQYEADIFLKDFKLKWETASNNTAQVVRDEKLNEILDGSN